MSAVSFSFPNAAVISDCGRFRYSLTRFWGVGEFATFVMLNPSTADATQDDPTIRRCIGFAKSWGMAGLRVVNLYALRSTDPRELWRNPDRVGPENNAELRAAAETAARHAMPLVAAWGAHGEAGRVATVLDFPHFDRLQALGVTKAGAPRHPLYLPANAQLAPWPKPTS